MHEVSQTLRRPVLRPASALRLGAVTILALGLAGCAAAPKQTEAVDPNTVAARAAAMQPAVTRIPRPPREAACLTQAELQAEEVIQYHSRLMVVALTCRTQRLDVDLYKTYMEFTNRHQTVIRSSEQMLIDRLRRSGWPNPAPRFDNWRSKVANELSIDAAREGLKQFCATAPQEILDAAKLPVGQFNAEFIPATYRIPSVDPALCSAARPQSASARPAAAKPAAPKAAESKPAAAKQAAPVNPPAAAKPAAAVPKPPAAASR